MEENKPVIRRRKKRDRFYIFYFVFCAALLLILTAFIIFFYDFIKEYETSRPERVAEQYINSLDGESLDALLGDDIFSRSSGFEAKDAVSGALGSVMKGSLVFTECIGEDSPTYDVFCDGKLMKVRLRETDGGKYGFVRYEVSDAEIYPEWLNSRFSDINVIAPADAAVYINGVRVTDEYKTGKTYESAVLSRFEPADHTLVEYAVKNIFGAAEVTGEFSGEALTFGRLKESPVYYSDFDVPSLADYTLKAPTDAAVTLNGQTLGPDFITDTANLTESITEFETANAPSLSVYTVKGMLTEPEVTVTLAGEALSPASAEKTHSEFSYPDSSRLSYTVKVPHGMTLYCNNIEVGASYKTEDGVNKYESPYTSKSYAATEAYDVYTIPLYKTPEFRVSAEAAASSVEGREVTFYQVPTAAEEAEIRAIAEEFAKQFIKYSLQGGSERVRANLDVCLSYTLSGSSASKMLESTFNAFRYNSNYKIIKDDTKVYDIARYSDKCISVKVDFDSLGKVYKYEKPASGTYYMVWVKSGDAWKLAVFNV